MEIKRILNIASLLMTLIINAGCEKEPFVITLEATGITNTGAVLRASTVPSSMDLYLEFEYGVTHDYGEKIEGIGIAGPGGGGIVSYEIGSLISGETYYFRAILKSTKNSDMIIYGDELKFTTTVKDRDGNHYNIVTIGTQTWMKENLKVTRLNDGTAVSLITDDRKWSVWLTTPAYCWYGNNINNKNIYGALYNVAAATGWLCPAGWHVPSVEEWTTLSSYLGENSGGAMKETGTLHWYSPNAGATNSSGFSGVAGGKRSSDGIFYGRGNYGHWWSLTFIEEFEEHWQEVVDVFTLHYDSTYGSITAPGYSEGYSVRCIRD